MVNACMCIRRGVNSQISGRESAERLGVAGELREAGAEVFED